MSEQEQKNLAVIQDLFDKFAKGDVHGAVTLVADDVKWIVCGTSADPWIGHYTSVQQVAEALRLHEEIVEVDLFRADKYVVQDDTVVVIGYEHIRFKTRNRLLGGPFMYSFVVKNDKIVEALVFRDDMFVDKM